MTCLCCLFQVNSIAIFLIGCEQNGTWTNQTCIINPKMKKSPTIQYPAYGMREVVVARMKQTLADSAIRLGLPERGERGEEVVHSADNSCL